MPIRCDIDFEACDQECFQKLDYAVTGAAMEIHRRLGNQLPEKSYQLELAHLLAKQGHRVATEVKCSVSHGSYSHDYFLDLVVNDGSVYELKTVRHLAPEHQKQLLGYLFLTDTLHGKLLNFRPASLEARFINTRYTFRDRLRFTLDHRDWEEPEGSDFIHHFMELLQDWGWGLPVELYLDAFLSLPCFKCVECTYPLSSNGRPLGSMKQTVFSDTGLFHLSFARENPDAYERTLLKTLAVSPFNVMFWVNMNHNRIRMKTVRN